MAIVQNDVDEVYGKDGTVVSAVPVARDITAPSIEYDLHAKARAALNGNAAALANLDNARTALATTTANAATIKAASIGSLTAAQSAIRAIADELTRLANVLDGTVQQTGRALRQDSQLIRLVIANDLLAENGDT